MKTTLVSFIIFLSAPCWAWGPDGTKESTMTPENFYDLAKSTSFARRPQLEGQCSLRLIKNADNSLTLYVDAIEIGNKEITTNEAQVTAAVQVKERHHKAHRCGFWDQALGGPEGCNEYPASKEIKYTLTSTESGAFTFVEVDSGIFQLDHAAKIGETNYDCRHLAK